VSLLRCLFYGFSVGAYQHLRPDELSQIKAAGAQKVPAGQTVLTGGDRPLRPVSAPRFFRRLAIAVALSRSRQCLAKRCWSCWCIPAILAEQHRHVCRPSIAVGDLCDLPLIERKRRLAKLLGRAKRRLGRPRKRYIPDILSRAAEDMLADSKWRNVSWRNGTKGRLQARFAAVRVRIADGPPQRIKDKGQQHLPGEEVWLIGEHRASGEKKYYLANLPAATDLRTLAATIKARWVCEQAHQQLKEELGLDHFEGRSWQGRHRHALMTMIAYTFLQYRRLAQAGRKKPKA
jgi:hypothetical protein